MLRRQSFCGGIQVHGGRRRCRPVSLRSARRRRGPGSGARVPGRAIGAALLTRRRPHWSPKPLPPNGCDIPRLPPAPQRRRARRSHMLAIAGLWRSAAALGRGHPGVAPCATDRPRSSMSSRLLRTPAAPCLPALVGNPGPVSWCLLPARSTRPAGFASAPAGRRRRPVEMSVRHGCKCRLGRPLCRDHLQEP